MKQKQQKSVNTRRSFFKTAVIGSLGAVTAGTTVFSQVPRPMRDSQQSVERDIVGKPLHALFPRVR
jgi:hypothetical protein